MHGEIVRNSEKQLYVWMQYVKVWEKILPCTSTEIYPVLLLWKEDLQEVWKLFDCPICIQCLLVLQTVVTECYLWQNVQQYG
jgi:hypothetical protein